MKQIFIVSSIILLFIITYCAQQQLKQTGASGENMTGLHPYLTACDPNIGRAFRIASGDIVSNVVPLPAMASILTPVSEKRWDDLSARVVEIAGTSEIQMKSIY